MTMMYTHLFAFSLLLLGFVRCGASEGQRTALPDGRPQKVTNSPESEVTPCDFSSSHPVTLRGFGGLGAPAVSKPQPVYPPEAKTRKIEGLVKVKVLLNIRGEVERACVIEGDEILGEAAQKAALKSKFGSHWGKQITKAGGSYGEGIVSYRFVLQ